MKHAVSLSGTRRVPRSLMSVGLFFLLLGSVAWSAVWLTDRHEQNNTLLIRAVYNGSLPETERLLKAGADVDLYIDGTTLRSPQSATVPLKGGGATVPYFDSQSLTPLHAHTFWRELLARLRHENAPSSTKSAPLVSFAISLGKQEIASYLLLRGADVEAADGKGSVPLHYAAEHNAHEILLDLLAHNADINHKNSEGNTPLHLAIYQRNIGNARLLLEHHADANITNAAGQTPLDLIALLCQKIHRQWLVRSMSNLAETKQEPQEQITAHFQSQLELLRPLITAMQKGTTQISPETKQILTDSFHFDNQEIIDAVK